MAHTFTHILTTDEGETVVGILNFKKGVVIATTRRVLYYGPDKKLTPVRPAK